MKFWKQESPYPRVFHIEYFLACEQAVFILKTIHAASPLIWNSTVKFVEPLIFSWVTNISIYYFNINLIYSVHLIYYDPNWEHLHVIKLNILIKDIKIIVLHSACLCFKLFPKRSMKKWPTATPPPWLSYHVKILSKGTDRWKCYSIFLTWTQCGAPMEINLCYFNNLNRPERETS